MKKILAGAAVMALSLLCLSGCGKKEDTACGSVKGEYIGIQPSWLFCSMTCTMLLFRDFFYCESDNRCVCSNPDLNIVGQ
ncbi:MAG: hypothetical protein FWB94_11425 [Chitinispirillia bacterium]|nr:hypothetical protein [Chitinispirillia bacterium]